jgi:hypothetical protein
LRKPVPDEDEGAALQYPLAKALRRANSPTANSAAAMADVGGMLSSDVVVVEL